MFTKVEAQCRNVIGSGLGFRLYNPLKNPVYTELIKRFKNNIYKDKLKKCVVMWTLTLKSYNLVLNGILFSNLYYYYTLKRNFKYSILFKKMILPYLNSKQISTLICCYRLIFYTKITALTTRTKPDSDYICLY